MANMMIDEVTTLRVVMCVAGANLIYLNSIDTNLLSESDVIQGLPSMKSVNIKRWCTAGDLRELLLSLDSVTYRYESEGGEYITEYTINRRDC